MGWGLFLLDLLDCLRIRMSIKDQRSKALFEALDIKEALPSFEGPLIDSHAHLNFPEFKGHLDAVLETAKKVGLQKILTIATEPDNWDDVLDIATRYDSIYATAGIHPCHVEGHESEGLSQLLEERAEHPKIVGFGETGFDFFHEPYDKKHQEAVFWQHINAGQLCDVPLIIHTRAAEDATLALLTEAAQNGTKAVIHCFTGTKAFAKACLDLGFYISFSGIVTFKNAKDLHEVARYVPLECMLVETDAPYLAPHPFRGKTNQPALTYYTAQKIADLKELTLQKVAEQTTENFYRLFSKVPADSLKGGASKDLKKKDDLIESASSKTGPARRVTGSSDAFNTYL